KTEWHAQVNFWKPKLCSWYGKAKIACQRQAPATTNGKTIDRRDTGLFEVFQQRKGASNQPGTPIACLRKEASTFCLISDAFDHRQVSPSAEGIPCPSDKHHP